MWRETWPGARPPSAVQTPRPKRPNYLVWLSTLLRMGRWNFPLAGAGSGVTGGQLWYDWGGRLDHRCKEKGLGGVGVDKGINATSTAASPQERALWCGRYLAGSDDEAVLILVLELFGVIQFLPADAHGHHTQLVVRAEVVGVLCWEK